MAITDEAPTTQDPRNSRPPPPPIEILGWRKHVSGSLRGFLGIGVRVGNGHGHILELYSCPVHKGGGHAWVNFAGAAQFDRSTLIVKCDAKTGKGAYTATTAWRHRECADAFSRAVIRLLLAKHPDALDP